MNERKHYFRRLTNIDTVLLRISRVSGYFWAAVYVQRRARYALTRARPRGRADACTAVARQLTEKKGLRTPDSCVRKKGENAQGGRGRRRRTFAGTKKGWRVGDRGDRGSERAAEKRSCRAIESLHEGEEKKKVSWLGALRDFWISASLVTREAKTVGQVASSRKKNRSSGVGDQIEVEEIEYPSGEPFESLCRVLNEDQPGKTYS